jgi:hypothetical protein
MTKVIDMDRLFRNGPAFYALEKLEAAVHELTVSASPLRGRLLSACIELQKISQKDIPAPFLDQLTSIKAEVTAKPSRTYRALINGTIKEMSTGTLASTLEHMRTDRMLDLVQRILSLRDSVRHHVYDAVTNDAPLPAPAKRPS